MSKRAGSWFLPISSFCLAVALSLVSGPTLRGYAHRLQSQSTGDHHCKWQFVIETGWTHAEESAFEAHIEKLDGSGYVKWDGHNLTATGVATKGDNLPPSGIGLDFGLAPAVIAGLDSPITPGLGGFASTNEHGARQSVKAAGEMGGIVQLTADEVAQDPQCTRKVTVDLEGKGFALMSASANGIPAKSEAKVGVEGDLRGSFQYGLKPTTVLTNEEEKEFSIKLAADQKIVEGLTMSLEVETTKKTSPNVALENSDSGSVTPTARCRWSSAAFMSAETEGISFFGNNTAAASAQVVHSINSYIAKCSPLNSDGPGCQLTITVSAQKGPGDQRAAPSHQFTFKTDKGSTADVIVDTPIPPDTESHKEAEALRTPKAIVNRATVTIDDSGNITVEINKEIGGVKVVNR